MKIRNGKVSEIKNFPLYNEDNNGNETLVAEEAGKIVAYAQITGNQIYFMESEMKGAGRALVEYLKSQNDSLVAVNCVESARGFYEKMNFQVVAGSSKLTPNYDWYEGDDD